MHIVESTGQAVENHNAPAVAAAARTNLERLVSEGIAKAGPVIQRVLEETPHDRLVHGRYLKFDVSDAGQVTGGTPKMGPTSIHRHAFAQMVGRVGLPRAYADSLAVADLDTQGQSVDNAWRRDLLKHSLNEHFKNDASRYLVRSVGGQVRGFLSDRYRRLDSRPLLDAFVQTCQEVNAVPFEGVANDLRTSVRAIVPHVFEPVPGEAMVFGLEWHNSDFGAGTYSVKAFALRLVCLNGMVGASEMQQVHLGKRLADNIEYSARTYELDTQTMVSATRDIVRSTMGERSIQTRVNAIAEAHSQEITWAEGWKRVSKALTKGEGQRAQDAFESEDVVMLPAGKTAWRFSNALSWIANQTDDADRKLELQRLAGQVVKVA